MHTPSKTPLKNAVLKPWRWLQQRPEALVKSYQDQNCSRMRFLVEVHLQQSMATNCPA
jgi:hypothetical protein